MTWIKELTSQEVMEMHDRIIERYGGTKGILYQGTVDHIVYLLNRTNDIFKKAALALDKIVKEHPFMDGNKRTGLEVADVLLRRNGYHVHASDAELLHMLTKIAKYECTVEKIETWLRKKVLPLHLC